MRTSRLSRRYRRLIKRAMWVVALGTLNVGCAEEGPSGPATITVSRVGEVHALHEADRGRAVFADVMLIGEDQVVATYQLAGPDSFCEGKSLYFQVLDRGLSPRQEERLLIDVGAEGSIFRQSSEMPGDLGDHKFTVVGDTVVMLTTVPGEPHARLIRFDSDLNPIDSLFDDSALSRVGDEEEDDRLLDMGFANDGENVYAQFYNNPPMSMPEDWGARIYKLDGDFGPIGDVIVQPEEGIFLTGNSLVFVPEGMMGATEDRLQSFSRNRDPGSGQPSGIHTFAVRASDLSLIRESTRTIAESELDLYFPTGADFNERHQVWVVGYTREIAAGVHGRRVMGANACMGTPQPAGEEYRELGPSFIGIFDADWNEIQTLELNDGEYAFRVMLETDGDDIYVIYDEMDLYTWRTISQAKIEHFRISSN